MKLAVLFSFFIICVNAEVELDEEEDWFRKTEPPVPIAEFSDLLQTLNKLDQDITRVLGSMAPDKMEGEQLIMNLHGYVMSLGPLIHWLASEKTDVMLVAKSVYHQGAPRFLSTPVNAEVVRQAFQWDENQMILVNTLHSMCAKTWQNFLNMCERHRVEG